MTKEIKVGDLIKYSYEGFNLVHSGTVVEIDDTAPNYPILARPHGDNRNTACLKRSEVICVYTLTR